MILRLLGCALIMLCAAKIGFDEAARYGKRVLEIRDFQTALLALKGEISFCRTPLAEALSKTGERLKTPVAEIFKKTAEGLRSHSVTAQEAWDGAVRAAKPRLALKADDIYIISMFGKLLGVSDAAGQLDNIELTSERLSRCETQAAEDERKLSKLYRSLGVIGGAFLAILFI